MVAISVGEYYVSKYKIIFKRYAINSGISI